MNPPGNPVDARDEADVRLDGTVNDVRVASDLSDYTGTLEARVSLRITDKDNTPHPGGPGAATTAGAPLLVPDPVRCHRRHRDRRPCTFDTTAEAFVPGIAKEVRRAIWELGAERPRRRRQPVHDGRGSSSPRPPAVYTLPGQSRCLAAPQHPPDAAEEAQVVREHRARVGGSRPG